ncbi:MAG TPA: hypothetical protein ENH01_03730 [Nitrospirae bacterium]|nr:hypothetical protein [Nitrospirota bacterium]
MKAGICKKVNESELQVKEQAKEISKHEHIDSLVTDKAVDDLKKHIQIFVNIFSDTIDPIKAKKIEASLNSPYFSKDIMNTILHKMFEVFEKIFNQFQYYYLPLHYFSVIMSHHAIAARYLTNGFNPLEIYTYSFPLIESFDIFTKFMDKTLANQNISFANFLLSLKEEDSCNQI